MPVNPVGKQSLLLGASCRPICLLLLMVFPHMLPLPLLLNASHFLLPGYGGSPTYVNLVIGFKSGLETAPSK
jgi:hypothetical protein